MEIKNLSITRKLVKLSILLLVFLSAKVFAEDMVTNGDWSSSGGDAVKCLNDKGRYVYEVVDAVRARQLKTYNLKDFRGSSESPIRQIINRLIETFPAMGVELRKLYQSYKKRSNDKVNDGIKWINEPERLKEYTDENLRGEFPDTCVKNHEQIVLMRRSANKSVRHYYYDPDKMREVEFISGQISWIIAHEFSWKYFQDAAEIRIFNSYLHSEKFFSATIEEVRQEFGQLGVPMIMIGMSFDDLQSKIIKLNADSELKQLLKRIDSIEEGKGMEESKMAAEIQHYKNMRNRLEEKCMPYKLDKSVDYEEYAIKLAQSTRKCLLADLKISVIISSLRIRISNYTNRDSLLN